MPDQIKVYGATWCPDCRRAKAFLAAHRVDYQWIDLDTHPEAVAEVEARNSGKRIIPTIIFPDGRFTAEPSNDELADLLGIKRDAKNDWYDVLIIGGGPTGLTAAIYAARENFSVLVVERSAAGGQAGVTERLDNYPGFPDGIAGAELASRIKLQAERYGVEILEAVSVNEISSADGVVILALSTGASVSGGAALIATGSTYRRTGADGEADLIGSGIHFCATCDGPFYRDAEEVVVVGGGNSGLEEGLFLTQFAKHVTVLERGPELRGNRLLQDKVGAHPRMSVLTQREVAAFVADDAGKLAGVTVNDLGSGESVLHAAKAAFVFIGLDPNASFVADQVELDPAGFIVTDRMFATKVPGVFAAGDVRAGSTKQLASAVGEGAAAAIQMRYHLDSLMAHEK
ncbi:MAG: FAD-dependent oxidoreductase [Actinomycetes bacterium]